MADQYSCEKLGKKQLHVVVMGLFMLMAQSTVHAQSAGQLPLLVGTGGSLSLIHI